MECFHPQFIRVNGGLQKVRCGRCLACLAHRQAEWITRLKVALDFSPGTAYFVTLTYDDDHLPMNEDTSQDYFGLEEVPLVPSVRKTDLQKFHMDLRKRFQQGFYYDHTLEKAGFGPARRIDLPHCKFRFYCTSEYGPNGLRPHYHGLYTHLPEDSDLTFDLFNQIWNKGFIYCEPALSEKAGAYVAKYLVNTSLVPIPQAADRPFALMSKGLGIEYLSPERVEWHRKAHQVRNYVPVQGSRQILPRYLRDKIFDDSMKADILEDALSRSEASQEVLDSMNDDEYIRFLEDQEHLEREAVAQAVWRFKKNGKIK